MTKPVISFLTLGCKVNQYDSDAMRAILSESGFDVRDGLEPADIFVVNTCAVTAEAERKSRQAAEKRGPGIDHISETGDQRTDNPAKGLQGIVKSHQQIAVHAPGLTLVIHNVLDMRTGFFHNLSSDTFFQSFTSLYKTCYQPPILTTKIFSLHQ